MRTRSRWLLAGVLACLSCGDDATAPIEAPVEPLCGQEGPVRLLPLDPAVKLYAGPGWQSVSGELVGERYVLTVTNEASPEASFVSQLWSVGLCGEDPALLADDVSGPDAIRSYPERPELRFVCHRDEQTLSAIDPEGLQDAHATFEVGSCRMLDSQAGMVAVLGDEDIGPLVLQPWPSDPLSQTAEKIVLLDAARGRVDAVANPGGVSRVLATHEQEVLAITSDDELVSVDLQDLTVTALASGVREFQVGESGRWVVWQARGDNPDMASLEVGPVYVLDRESGESAFLAEAGLGLSGRSTLLLEAFGVVFLRSDFERMLLSLASQEQLSNVAGTPRVILDDGRIVTDFPYRVVDLDTWDTTLLYDGLAEELWIRSDGLELLPKSGGELLHIPYDTAEPRTLAQHAYQYWQRTSDDRILTLASRNESTQAGPLVVVDTATLEAAQIEANVHFASITAYDTADALLVSYAVVDADPERHGVWLRGLAR